MRPSGDHAWSGEGRERPRWCLQELREGIGRGARGLPEVPGLRREFGELLWGEERPGNMEIRHCPPPPPHSSAFWNVARWESLKAAGLGLWGQAHQQTGNPQRQGPGSQSLPWRRCLSVVAE